MILLKKKHLDENEIGMENNLVVLDPDHPLMERFQRALKNQLLKREQKLTLEAREVRYQLEVSYFQFFKISVSIGSILS